MDKLVNTYSTVTPLIYESVIHIELKKIPMESILKS